MPPDVPQVVAALNEAADSLFPHLLYKGAHDLHCTVIEGRATRAHEVLTESLGVNFLITRSKPDTASITALRTNTSIV